MSVKYEAKKLRKMIDALGDGEVTRYVADGVSYGVFQEWGTHKMGAQPFMRPGVEAVRPSFERGFRGADNLMQVEAVVEKAAFNVERVAKIEAPVDTGALRASLHVTENEPL